MDSIARACLAMCKNAHDACAEASEDTLVQWAAEDSIRGMFAQNELVYRDQQAFIDAVPLEADDAA